ncbi:TIGR04219 family outer membrane beta-barrel protein [Moraxella sp. FZLJ2107]|uniref:TIGR04219 family outer membrane beta-barrel protein n=1 Tax=unclassified Moraxella TaxID=2685852 RepID=UPI00209C534F|nr:MULTISPECIES: TIGR04219 family outer membrane beta-barrel protein [unclassified Moraxella]USZ15143.1 TIGR04219 family outer membrane beta-barrel protein [Moraxella sp. FZFQ2102]UTO05863.1 TIGR04219 family outer membrane beta-barrel protein [Moraxella sp. FZLJ2107]UTO22599.1 TIGR04219 family outer membrane beta-barrel protein [Moraxella sp. FZLJ2109]
MKKLLLSSLILATAATTAHADTLYGLYVDGNYWHTSADITDDGKDRNFDDKGNFMASASFEHGVPLVPNVRVRYASLNSTEPTLTSSNEIDFTSTDAIAYYELLDNVVSLDVGLGAKRISGDVKYAGGSTMDLDKTMPMAYASVGAKLPFTGLSAKAELGVGVGSNVKATDAQAEVKYDFIKTPVFDLGLKGGYRILSVDYDETKVKYLGSIFGEQTPYKAEFKGPYVGLEAHF